MTSTARERAPRTVVLGDGPLGLDGYEAVVYGDASVALGDGDAVERHRAELERQVAGGARIYAVSTGYGADAGRAVPVETIARVQRDTLRSHAVGVGDPVPDAVVRGMLLIKAQAYAQGPAALRREVVERLVEMLNRRIHPVVPLQGSQ
ncbi:MAG TPA: aromatic amino acid lyase, partial [Conexibacter sp.]|nr:aromatic amino acid lyase [Conexibacter sp.]